MKIFWQAYDEHGNAIPNARRDATSHDDDAATFGSWCGNRHGERWRSPKNGKVYHCKLESEFEPSDFKQIAAALRPKPARKPAAAGKGAK